MPIYEYEDSCGRFEEIFSMKQDSSMAVCPKCGRFAEKVISVPRVQVFESFYHAGFGRQINSKQELKDECARTGCTSPYLEGCGSDIDGDKVEVKPWRERPRKKMVEMGHGKKG